MKRFRLTVIMLVVGVFVLLPVVGSAQSDAAIEWYNKGVDACFEAAFQYPKQNFDKSIEYFTKAISIDPNYAKAYNSRGDIYEILKRYNEAIADYTKAISIKPYHAQYYYKRGSVYNKIEKYNEAIADYTKAISIYPNDAYAYYNRGNTYNAMGENEKAQADFKKACDGGIESACKELKK